MTNDPNETRPRLTLPTHEPTDKRPLAERAAEKLYRSTSKDKRTDSSRAVPGSESAPVASPQKRTHFKLRRDDNVPLEFDGVVLGEIEDRTPSRGNLLTIITRAALYQTRGGKYITEFSRRDVRSDVPTPLSVVDVFAKAAVFDSRDIALQWFRKGGRFTLRLLEQIGALESEFIE